MQCQLFLASKVSPSLKPALLPNSETYASTLEASANAAEIEIGDFQDLMNLCLCFQPRPSCFNVGLCLLSATTAASEIWIRRQERPTASMGAAAQREVGGGWCVCHSEPSLTLTDQKRIEREDDGGSLGFYSESVLELQFHVNRLGLVGHVS